MNEFGAKFDGKTFIRIEARKNAAADPVAGFQYQDLQTLASKDLRGAQPRRARAHDDDIRSCVLSFRHAYIRCAGYGSGQNSSPR